MDKSELAKKMLKWETLQRQLDVLTEEIQKAVLPLGGSVNVGNVCARYSGGRRTFNHKAAVENCQASHEVIALFTRRPDPVTDWRGICEHLKIEDIPFTKSAPSVSVTLVK